jgi:hypothetical protein
VIVEPLIGDWKTALFESAHTHCRSESRLNILDNGKYLCVAKMTDQLTDLIEMEPGLVIVVVMGIAPGIRATPARLARL